MKILVNIWKDIQMKKVILLFVEEKMLKKFSYCPLHLMIVFQPKGKKEDIIEKEDEVPQFIEKKIKSA